MSRDRRLMCPHIFPLRTVKRFPTGVGVIASPPVFCSGKRHRTANPIKLTLWTVCNKKQFALLFTTTWRECAYRSRSWVLSLETIKWLSTHISNYKSIYSDTKPVATFGCIVDRMTDIMRRSFSIQCYTCELIFLFKRSYDPKPWLVMYVQWKVRSNLGYLITIRTAINRFGDDAQTIRPSVQYVSVFRRKRKDVTWYEAL